MSTRPLVPEDISESAQRRSLHRAIAALALARAGGRGHEPEAVLRKAWPSESRAGIALRAISVPTGLANIPQAIAVASFRSLAPSSAAMRLFGLGIEVDLRGVAGVDIPSVASPPTAAFVGENQAIPVTDGALRAIFLGPPKKLGVIASLSAELDAATPDGASAIIARILDDAIAKALDAAAFGDEAATSIQPAGLLHDVEPVAPAAAGDGAMADDIANLVGSIADHGVAVDSVALVAAPRQATRLRFAAGPAFDLPIITGSGLEDGRVIAVAPIGLTSFLSPPRIDVANAAMLHRASPATGGLADPSGSDFQQNLSSLKVVTRAAWCCEPGAVAFVDKANW